LSTKRKEEFRAQIEDQQAPPFNVENAMGLLGGLVNDLDAYFAEAVKEIFDWLKPGAWDKKYKTNEKSRFEIGKKIIVTWVMRWEYGRMSMWPRSGNSLIDLDKMFHLLDGQGVPKYPGDLVTQIRSAINGGENEVETAYFSLKWYKNGNLHLTFLRDDLLQAFNAKAGERLLRGDER
jgi:hypothetical protein